MTVQQVQERRCGPQKPAPCGLRWPIPGNIKKRVHRVHKKVNNGTTNTPIQELRLDTPIGHGGQFWKTQAAYNSEELLESLIERLDKCVDFATEAGDPVSETQLVRIAYGLVAETGQYPEDCRAWRNHD